MTDSTYGDLVNTTLVNNNTGAITEDDIRTIVRFANPIGLQVYVRSSAVAASYDYTYSTTVRDAGINAIRSGTTVTAFQTTETGSLNRSASDIQYTSLAGVTTVPRVFNVDWDIEYMVSGSLSNDDARGLAFYKHNGSFTGTILRAQASYISPGFTDGTNIGYKSSGSLQVVLSPGESLRPIVHTYGGQSATALNNYAFNLNVSSLGPTTAAKATSYDAALGATLTYDVPVSGGTVAMLSGIPAV